MINNLYFLFIMIHRSYFLTGSTGFIGYFLLTAHALRLLETLSAQRIFIFSIVAERATMEKPQSLRDIVLSSIPAFKPTSFPAFQLHSLLASQLSSLLASQHPGLIALLLVYEPCLPRGISLCEPSIGVIYPPLEDSTGEP
jgi:hypothetical protein